MNRKRYNGSITIFAALAIMLVAQLLFTLIEGARGIEFRKVIQMNTDSVLESVFADYNGPLWEEYRLLGLVADNADGELSLNNRCAQMQMLSQKNFGSDTSFNLFCADVTDINADSYLLMTDGGGRVFEQAVSAYMKENLAYELAKGIYNNYESIKDLQDQYGDGSDKISGALDALDEAKKEAANDSGSKEESKGVQKAAARQKSRRQKAARRASGEKRESDENPISVVLEAQKKGILGVVLPESAKLSGAGLVSEQRVSKRNLAHGTALLPSGSDWYDKTLFTQYACNYMSSYTEPISNHALRYEMEYLIGGKCSDEENLRITVDRLLVIREGLNMASIMAMPDKQADAEALAIALAGATVNPVIIEAVKYGILAAWAYVESVLDVRALLDGDRISLIKSEATWTSTIDNFPTLLSGWNKAKSCDTGGLNYKQYGTSLLLFKSGETLAIHAMDVEEATIRSMEDYAAFRMDHVVCEMEIQATYEYHDVFMTFVSMVKETTGINRIMDSAGYSYFQGKEGV